jgi:hypothetical protein
MNLLSRFQKKTVILLGSSRSGTTWLSEVVNYENNYRYIFEPCRKKITLKSCPFDDISPIPSSEDYNKYRTYFNKILKGRIRTHWTDYWSPIRYSRRKLIKEVRINFLLGWLHKEFSEAKIIFIIRNPYAVTASRARTNGGWEDYFDREKAIVNKMDLFNKKQLEYINSKKLTREEKYFTSWCIENIVALKSLDKQNHVQFIYYEDLVKNTKTVLTLLFQYLGDDTRPKLWSKALEPSKTSKKKRGKIKPRYATNWNNELSKGSMHKLKKPHQLFNIDRLYPDSYYPDKSAFETLIG